MPLEKAEPGTPGFSRNIEREMEAGKPQKQAVAIAYEKSREDEQRADASGREAAIRSVENKFKRDIEKWYRLFPTSLDQVRYEAKRMRDKIDSDYYQGLNAANSRKDGTAAVTGMFSAHLDEALRACDGLYGRADAAARGDWSGVEPAADASGARYTVKAEKSGGSFVAVAYRNGDKNHTFPGKFGSESEALAYGRSWIPTLKRDNGDR